GGQRHCRAAGAAQPDDAHARAVGRRRRVPAERREHHGDAQAGRGVGGHGAQGRVRAAAQNHGAQADGGVPGRDQPPADHARAQAPAAVPVAVHCKVLWRVLFVGRRRAVDRHLHGVLRGRQPGERVQARGQAARADRRGRAGPGGRVRAARPGASALVPGDPPRRQAVEHSGDRPRRDQAVRLWRVGRAGGFDRADVCGHELLHGARAHPGRPLRRAVGRVVAGPDADRGVAEPVPVPAARPPAALGHRAARVHHPHARARDGQAKVLARVLRLCAKVSDQGPGRPPDAQLAARPPVHRQGCRKEAGSKV
ncbi:hypothetical protein IWW51_006853, partial [Coemansia sp. RSA 2702]